MMLMSYIRFFGVLISVSRSPGEKTRYDTSLGLLTKKFVGLLRNAPDGVSFFNFIFIIFLFILFIYLFILDIQTNQMYCK